MQTEVITRSIDLPTVSQENFFHSSELFKIVEQTSGLKPYMVIVKDKEDRVVAHLFAMLRRRWALLPPYLFTQGRVYGEGVYREDVDRQIGFNLMLKALSKCFHSKLCLYIEFSDLSKKMFGYKEFRKNGYFPISWMKIHNSLHSCHPKERLSTKYLNRILRTREPQIKVFETKDVERIKNVYKLLKTYYRFRLQRYLPSESFFHNVAKSKNGKIFVATYKEETVGGALVAVSNNNAYLWYVAAKEKRHPLLHPTFATVWKTIENAYLSNCRHIYFMNVGLPYRRNRYRDFILGFGGKPVSTYRWFHFTINWLNKIASWFFRE